jgi:Transposase
VDRDGEVAIRKRVSRAKLLEFFAGLPPCVIGIEACPTAHHWSRKLQALGHTVRLMPPSYVKGYLKRSKNDANDAAAICEAVTRPSMRFVPIKSGQQQSGLMLHRSRQLLVRQRTMLSDAIRGHMAELGIISAKGRSGRACGRRVTKLYVSGPHFLCRHCHQLTYACQHEGPGKRAQRRANKIRMRLGGDPDRGAPYPAKPRGVWWSRYLRLCHAATEAQNAADRAIIAETRALWTRLAAISLKTISSRA